MFESYPKATIDSPKYGTIEFILSAGMVYFYNEITEETKLLSPSGLIFEKDREPLTANQENFLAVCRKWWGDHLRKAKKYNNGTPFV